VNKLNRRSFYSLILNYDRGDRTSLKVSSISYPLHSEIHGLPERIQILRKAGLKEYAIREAMEYEGPQQCMILKELGAWVKAIRCARENQIPPLVYPVAYPDIVEEVAEEIGLDPFLILALIRQESMFQKDAVSIAGAMGLMQLLPSTAKRVAKREGIELSNHRELFHPDINIRIGAIYLKKLVEQFQSLPVALAAYNAGEHRVRRWIASYRYRSVDEFIEDIPFAETRNYTKKVIFNYFQYRTLYSPF
jgi:soluble lytic murein transglycosylase